MGSGQSSQGPEPVEESVRTPRRPLPTSEDLESREVCVFPLIGRLDPRSNWVPHHYLRGLLSLVGGQMFQYLGVHSVEIWRLRVVGRTFRYGVASAYERAQGARLVERGGRDTPVYDLSQARVPMPQDEEDDPTLDQVRHVDFREDWGPPLQDLQLQEAASSSSSEWYGSDESRVDTTRPPTSDMEPHSPVSLRGPLEGDAEFAGSEPARNETDHEGRAGHVAYRALDAALLVLYGERELRVELPGWSFEEVHSIVRSIQEGDWSHFYEVMSWGPSRINWSVGPASSSNQAVAAGEIAVGSEDEVPIVSQEEAEAQASFFQDEEGIRGFLTW